MTVRLLHYSDKQSSYSTTQTDSPPTPLLRQTVRLLHYSDRLSAYSTTQTNFTRSCLTIADFAFTAPLQNKQVDLKLPAHKIIHDVPTRWNSSLDVVDWFLEQHTAVQAVVNEIGSDHVSSVWSINWLENENSI